MYRFGKICHDKNPLYKLTIILQVARFLFPVLPFETRMVFFSLAFFCKNLEHNLPLTAFGRKLFCSISFILFVTLFSPFLLAIGHLCSGKVHTSVEVVFLTIADRCLRTFRPFSTLPTTWTLTPAHL